MEERRSETSRDAQPAPTGCFKCGRPGHWSRDCPDATDSVNKPLLGSSTSFSRNPPHTRPTTIPKKRATRPKLTPELLLSDDGLGFVLRYFPRSFKYRGRGNEVNDLGSLIRLYRDWHAHLLPYYSFDQFVRKVEKVGATRRVKTCIRDLRERVSRGGDPTRLYEAPIEGDAQDNDSSALNSGANNLQSDAHVDDLPEDLLNETYEKAAQETLQTSCGENGGCAGPAAAISHGKEPPNVGSEFGVGCNEDESITEEQRARMEANKLKALERVTARSSNEVHISEEQRARMEANRLKALERAAARAQLFHSDS